MSVFDPRVVAQALEDIQQELERWTAEAQECLAGATYSQKQAREAAERTLHHAAIVANQAQEDNKRVQHTGALATENLDKCLQAAAIAHQTLQQAIASLQRANATLQKWEAELAKALAWLKRAEARLARAVADYDRAKKALESAKRNLNNAIEQYNRCARDQERDNCDREANAVRAAERQVKAASMQVEIAYAELLAAQEEVDLAKARVACCKRAVAYAKEALAIAQQAKENADQATNSAERSLEYVQAADRSVRIAEEHTAAQHQAAENMMADAAGARNLTEEAAQHLITADRLEESAQRYASGVRLELGHRAQLLHDLNRPPTVGANSGTGKVAPPDNRKSATHKRFVEQAAVTAVRNKLYQMGFQSVRQLQYDKIHGVDLAAFKYDQDGQLAAGAVIEVKGRSGRTPGPSAFKKQVRRSYYLPRLQAAKENGVKGARDLTRLDKKQKLVSYGATYGLQDKGKGPRIYKIPRRGPIAGTPINSQG